VAAPVRKGTGCKASAALGGPFREKGRTACQRRNFVEKSGQLSSTAVRSPDHSRKKNRYSERSMAVIWAAERKKKGSADLRRKMDNES